MLQYSNNLDGIMEQETISKNDVNLNNHLIIRVIKRFIGIAITCLLILFFANFTFKSHENLGSDTEQIIGVWTRASANMEEEMIKIITKDHFIWTHTVNNVIVRSAGGTYTYDGETYTEHIRYGSQGMSNFIDKKSIVKVQFDGKRMITSGLLADVVFINEVWERLE
jgi:hypothetical protein